ncbi:MAG: hypothetical protein AAF514_17815 [Verrucomicrobiota bacterium]
MRGGTNELTGEFERRIYDDVLSLQWKLSGFAQWRQARDPNPLEKDLLEYAGVTGEALVPGFSSLVEREGFLNLEIPPLELKDDLKVVVEQSIDLVHWTEAELTDRLTEPGRVAVPSEGGAFFLRTRLELWPGIRFSE